MTIHVLRKDGKLRGFALLFGKKGRIVSFGNELEYWRLCDGCLGRNLAVVYCRAHSVYLCTHCLSFHSQCGVCAFISMAVARELAQTAMIRAEVEAR